MTLADLIDLEAQLAHDEGEDRARLHARDRALLPAGGVEAARPHRLLSHWLEALRTREPGRAWPGARVVSALRLLRAVLVVVGLAAGWSTASVVLWYEGRHPVNVWDALLVFVGAQLALLLLLAVALALPARTLGVPFLGVGRAALGAAARALAARLALPGETTAGWRAVFARLRTRHRLHARIEALTLLGLTQLFAVAFNLGALLAFLRLVTFSDLAFAWSTTLDVDAEAFHRIVQILAAPWAGLLPEAVPTRALVEATRYSRLEGAYFAGPGTQAADAIRAGGWWPFLLLATFTYGLLPRLLALLYASLRRAWLLSRLPLQDLEVRRVVDRLSRPTVTTQSPQAEGPREPTPRIAAVPPTGLLAGQPPCALVLWRDLPAEALGEMVAAQLGCAPGSQHRAGGRKAEETLHTRDALGAQPGPVVLAAEAWEAPDQSVLSFLAEVRRSVGPIRPVVVLLVGAGEGAPDSEDVAVWSRRLAILEDAHLGVEVLS